MLGHLVIHSMEMIRINWINNMCMCMCVCVCVRCESNSSDNQPDFGLIFVIVNMNKFWVASQVDSFHFWIDHLIGELQKSWMIWKPILNSYDRVSLQFWPIVMKDRQVKEQAQVTKQISWTLIYSCFKYWLYAQLCINNTKRLTYTLIPTN